MVKIFKILFVYFKKCLKLICFPLLKDNSVPTHQNNLQKLTIEMFKTYTGLAPQIMN